jgi:hypothetical protein
MCCANSRPDPGPASQTPAISGQFGVPIKRIPMSLRIEWRPVAEAVIWALTAIAGAGRAPAKKQKVCMRYVSPRAALAAVCCAVIGISGTPSSAGDRRIVVELFTSQGCSSCPAADKLLAELSKDPTVLPISLSVDYWDYLGWKDTLALPGHAKRQRAYAGTRGDRAVYTPQAVINGTTHVLGSDKHAIERAVKQARANAQRASVPMTVSVADGKINVDIAAGKPPSQAAEIWLCPMKKQVPVSIGRGENRGQSIVYTNVVRGWIKLGEWKGEALQVSKPLSELPNGIDVDSVAVLVQGGKQDQPGNVYGAATASLK